MFDSSLYNENTFYAQFRQDLMSCRKEVIVESPFINSQRMKNLFPVFKVLCQRRVDVYVVTRDPQEHILSFSRQAVYEIKRLQALGVSVFFCEKGHHRKLAILDRTVLWEGSLNILSQTDSIEMMRRIESEKHALEMLRFSNLEQYLSV